MFELATVIGHRGLAAVAPENTLAGLRAAKAHGLGFVEVDILPSADGVAVLSHDETLLRRGGIGRRVLETTAAELAQTPVGRGFPDDENETVPTLQSALALAAELELGMVLELKTAGGRRGAESLAHAVRDAKSSGKIPPRIILASFGMDELSALRESLPDIPRALNVGELPDDWRKRSEDLGCENIHAHWRAANPLSAASLSEAGLGFYCYTVNSRAQYFLMRGLGVNGVFTDSPKVAAFA